MTIRNLLCCVLLALASLSHAATYTVSTAGQDSNPGTPAAPWRTLQHAAQTAVAGDTVTLVPGTYAERITFPTSGTAAQPITFVGTRGPGDTWETIIDGSMPVTAPWEPAPEMGVGVWKATLGYGPRAMSSTHLAIWRLGDHAMNGNLGPLALNRGPTETVQVADLGRVPFWDGVEALFGVKGTTTYLRFRTQQSPATMSVRAAPGGAVLDTNGQSFLVFKDLKVRGGQWAVRIRGGSQGTLVDQCHLSHGQYRVLHEGGRNTVLRNSTLTYDGIGFATHTPGDWTDITPARITNRHQYNLNKFEVGDTNTDDSSIVVTDGAIDASITGNTIRNSMAGITFYGTSSGTDVAGNTIFQHSDNCIYVNQHNTQARIHHNLIYDCDHGIRLESTENVMQLDIYANRFWQPRYTPERGPKHLFISTRPSYAGSSLVRVYHNSFAGGGWAADAGGGHFPFVHFRNNLLSTLGVSSTGATWATFQDNRFDPLWFTNTRPTFVLPVGHSALNTAPSLLPLGWPGMTTEYYGDGQPDYGAIQAEGPEEPPVPTITVTMTAPAPGATVRGSVPVTASATGPIAGVQFLLDGAPLGGEQCCSSNQILWNTTTTPDGLHSLAARGRTAAGLTVTTPPVAITVANVVAPANRPPVPTAPAITTPYQTAGSSQIAPNDPDAGQSHTYAVTTIPLHGIATVSASGLLTYTPEPGYSGTDSFTVTVADNGIPPLAGTLAVAVTVQAPIPTTVIVPWQCAGTLTLSDGVPTSSTLTCGKP